MIDVFLVHDDVERASVIRSAINANPELSLAFEGTTGKAGLYALQTIHKGHPRMCIVRLNLGDIDGFSFIDQVRQKVKGKVTLVPALEGNEAGPTYKRLMALELLDTIDGGMPAHEIAKVLDTVSKKCEADVIETTYGECFTVSVMSGRSGVGKSVIATNLAVNIAQRAALAGAAPESVALLDFSMNVGDFAAFLDDVPRRHIMDAVNDAGNLDSEMLQNFLPTHPRLGFRYLAHPNQDMDVSAFDYTVASNLLNSMKSVAGHVIIDTGAWGSGPCMAAAGLSDVILLVTTRDIPRLMSTANTIRYLKDWVELNKIKVLVNQSEIGAEDMPDANVEEWLEHSVTAYIPSNPSHVMLSVNSATPITIMEPNIPVSVVLSKLGEHIFNKFQDKGPPPPSKPSRPRGFM
ncbi:MAG: CpaE family protein [Candidatus Methylacidiphilales bacterium]|nr:hypothetical protein [Candidatus Methylacidiphilales bacterium]